MALRTDRKLLSKGRMGEEALASSLTTSSETRGRPFTNQAKALPQRSRGSSSRESQMALLDRCPTQMGLWMGLRLGCIRMRENLATSMSSGKGPPAGRKSPLKPSTWMTLKITLTRQEGLPISTFSTRGTMDPTSSNCSMQPWELKDLLQDTKNPLRTWD